MDVYEIITEKITAKLKAGIIPWQKPWNVAETGLSPYNLVSKSPYHGMNVLLTGMSGYSCAAWVSYKQAQELGGNVRKGEHGTPVVYWNFVDKTDDAGEVVKRTPFLRYFTVFNLEQCEGIELPAAPAPRKLNPIEAAEKLVDDFKGKPPVRFGGNRACYWPVIDQIDLPPAGSFKRNAGYYSTLFHELVHSTGHKSRLARPEIVQPYTYGTDPYAKEELVAEIGASFLCGLAGISELTIDNSAAYIGGWLHQLEKEPRMIVLAAGKAQKAVDFILGEAAERAEPDVTESVA